MKRDRSLFDRIVHFIVFRGKEIEIFFLSHGHHLCNLFPFCKGQLRFKQIPAAVCSNKTGS